jgi:hypothetical protein
MTPNTRIRIRDVRGTSFQGVEGHIVGEVDGEWLVQLDGETRPMRFAKAMVEPVDSPVRWCASTLPAPGYCPDDVPGNVE